MCPLIRSGRGCRFAFMEKQCLGCPKMFEPKRPNQSYHAAGCQKRNAKKKGRPRASYPAPLMDLVNDFFVFLRVNKPEGAIGYRLHSRQLDITLPWPGSPRRNGTRPKSKDFQLDEVPLVPLSTSYTVIWVYAGGGALPSYPPNMVMPGWVDDMRRMGEVGRRLRLYLARQRTEDAVAAQVHKGLIALAHGGATVDQSHQLTLPWLPPHQLPPHQLPPHQQGQPNDDPSGT